LSESMQMRQESPPDDAVVVIRSGEHGLDHNRVVSTCQDCFDIYGFLGLSVYAAIDQTYVDLCKSNPALGKHGMIRIATFGDLRKAKFPMLATGAHPHYSVVLADLESETVNRLIDCFSEPIPNPAKE
jgi:hypothetical protein